MRRHLLTAVIVFAVVVAAGVAALPTHSARYKATAEVVLLPSSAGVAAGPLFGQGLPSFLATYAHLSAENSYVSDVANATGQDTGTISHDLSVQPGTSGAILNVSATTSDAGTSAVIANAAADQLAKTVDTSGGSSSNSSSRSLVKVRVIPASTPRSPVTLSNTIRYASLVLVALIAAVLVALVVDWLFRRVTDPIEAQEASGAPTMGLLPTIRPKSAGPSSVMGTPEADPLMAACIRDLRANLVGGLRSPRRTVVVTGLRKGAGATTIAVNLAQAMEEWGESVAVIDATGTNDASAALEAAGSQIPLFTVQSARGAPKAVLEAMNSIAGERYDRIIIDAPAVQSATTTLAASSVDAVLVAIPVGGVQPSEMRRTIERLRMVGAGICGVVITRAKRRTAARWSTSGSMGEDSSTPAGAWNGVTAGRGNGKPQNDAGAEDLVGAEPRRR